MDDLTRIIEAMDRLTAAHHRMADATFALAQATAGPIDEDDEQPDPPMAGSGMGMG